MISEDPKYFKIKLFRGSALDPAGELTDPDPRPLAGGDGS